MLVEAPRPSDDLETFKRRVCLAISRLSTSKLGQSASPAFAGLTVGGGTVSSTLIGQWNTAYSWGDHAGLYDPIGTAAGEIGDHEATYDHSLLHSPVTLGTANGLSLDGQEVSLPITATPQFAGLTITDSVWVGYTGSLYGLAVGATTISGCDMLLDQPNDRNPTIQIQSYGTRDPYFVGRHAGGTKAVPSATPVNEILFALGAGGHDGTNWVASSKARIVFKAEETWGDAAQGTSITFGTTNTGSTNTYTRMSIRPDGKVGIGTESPNELLEVAGKIRALTAFNLNGTDGVSNSGSGVPTALTISGGIVTSVTKNDWLDQSAKTTATPQFAGMTLSGGMTVDSSTLHVDAVNHRVGVGTTGPKYPFHVFSDSQNVGLTLETDGYQGNVRLIDYRDSDLGSYIVATHYRGSKASPAVVQDGDRLLTIQAYGYSAAASTTRKAAEISMYIDGTPDSSGDSSDMPGRIVFSTTADGTSISVERMRITNAGYVGIGTTSPNEWLEVNGKIRADSVFNCNGTDGVTQAASSGKVCDVTALAGGIATAQTQITYAANGTYNFDATSGKVSSITITNGRITAITTAA